ncbi:MAG TPA: hypothetical protein IAC25_03365 [Candidatus Enterenecus stercoripullorum]|nr:hypothetical protein [Candidatus Enterenecus stercoripullorum]
MRGPDFWSALDELVRRSELVIDRPKGSAHPRFPSLLYPLDCGYLTSAAPMDRSGITLSTNI